MSKSNAISGIVIYKWNDLWVFDDDTTGLVREPFVAGIDTMIDALLLSTFGHQAIETFTCLFSQYQFPGSVALTWQRFECNGDIYTTTIDDRNLEGWLCPALRLYFTDHAPERLYVQFKAT